MKIVAISDTHLQHDFLVPEGDMIILSGDVTWVGSLPEIVTFNKWFSSLPHKYKLFCAGNHDRMFQTDSATAKSLLDSSLIYLEKNLVEIEGLKIYGSPWTPVFSDWAFMYDRREADLQWKNTPKVDILITHGPPYEILDTNRDGDNVGCTGLRKTVINMKPKYHIFGHIHEQYGTKKDGETTYVNASVVDSHYDNVHEPLVIEI